MRAGEATGGWGGRLGRACSPYQNKGSVSASSPPSPALAQPLRATSTLRTFTWDPGLSVAVPLAKRTCPSPVPLTTPCSVFPGHLISLFTITSPSAGSGACCVFPSVWPWVITARHLSAPHGVSQGQGLRLGYCCIPRASLMAGP